MVALYPHLACVCMWVSLLSLFGLCIWLQLHIPLLSISSRAPALASWRTAARVQVARIHECIALHWDLHPLPSSCPPACLPATPIQLQLCHPQNLQQMHSAVLHPNCGNLAEGKAVCTSSAVEKSGRPFWRWGKMLGQTLDTDEQATCPQHSILTKVAAG